MKNIWRVIKLTLSIIFSENCFLGKKKAKIPPQQQKPAAPAPQIPAQSNQVPVEKEQALPPQLNELPPNINWEDHSETRDIINQRVPGGVEAVDALIKLLKENQAASQ